MQIIKVALEKIILPEDKGSGKINPEKYGEILKSIIGEDVITLKGLLEWMRDHSFDFPAAIHYITGDPMPDTWEIMHPYEDEDIMGILQEFDPNITGEDVEFDT